MISSRVVPYLCGVIINTLKREIMKNKIKLLSAMALVFSTMLFSITEGFAQDKPEKPKKNFFGIMAGTNVSTLTNYDGKSLISLTGGLLWDWKFSEKFTLSTIITYNQRGENENGDVESLKLGYIYASNMLKYLVNEKFSFASGFFWDNLISVSEHSIHTRETLRASDFGIPIAVNYNITPSIEIGACYNFGLLNKSYISGTTLKNNWGTLTIAYVFR